MCSAWCSFWGFRLLGLILNVINDHIDTVSTQVEDQAAPDHLAQRATELGMVPAGVPRVVDLGAGQVVGSAPAGQDGEQPR